MPEQVFCNHSPSLAFQRFLLGGVIAVFQLENIGYFREKRFELRDRKPPDRL